MLVGYAWEIYHLSMLDLHAKYITSYALCNSLLNAVLNPQAYAVFLLHLSSVVRDSTMIVPVQLWCC